jgi:hypothetical protein
MNLLFWSLIFLNATLPLLEEMNQVPKTAASWKITGIGFTLTLQLVSCLFLTAGILKINKVVKTETGTGLKIK